MKQFWSTSIFILTVLTLINCNNSGSKEKLKYYNIPELDNLTEKIEKDPKNAALYAARSLVFSEKEMLQEAELDAEKAFQLDSTKIDYYRLLADAYFENLHSYAAVKTIQKAIGRFPQEKALYLNLAEMQMILEQYKDCAYTLDMLFKISPENPDGIFIRAMVKKLNADTTEALKDFEKVVALDADHVGAYMELAILKNKVGDPITLSYLNNVLRIDSMHEGALLTKAQYYHFRSEYDKALTEYENAILKINQSSDINYNLALMYLEMGDAEKGNKDKRSKYFESALRHFDNSTKFDPKFADAYYYKAIAALRLDRKDLAKRDLENAMRLNTFLQTISPEKVEQELAKINLN